MISGAKSFLFRQGCCRLVSLGLVTLFLLSMAAIVDLKTASVEKMKVNDLTVDLTRSVPYFAFDMNFQYSSKLSNVQPKEVRCSFVDDSNAKEKSSAEIVASFQNRCDESFQVEVTCSEEDVDTLSRDLWSLVSAYFAADSDTSGRLQDFVRCEMEIGISFLRAVSLHHVVNLPQDELVRISAYFEKQLAKGESKGDNFVSPVKDETEASNSKDEDEDKNNGETLRTPSSEIHVGMEAFQATYRLTMPSWVSDMLSRIQITSPSIKVAFQGPILSNETSQRYFFPDAVSLLTISRVNATYKSNEDESEADMFPTISGSDLIFVDAKCSDPHGCPWFGPWLDWYSLAFDNTANPIDIIAVVNAEGSFLESFVGRKQGLSIDYSPSGSEIVLGRQRELSATLEDQMEDFAKECLGLSDSSSTFDFAVCWLFRFNEGILLTGDLFFFENVAFGLFKTMWDKNAVDVFQGNTTALMQFGIDGVVVNATGGLFLDWSGLESIAFSLEGTMGPGTRSQPT